MALGDTHVFPGFLTPVLDLTQLFFPKSPTTFSHAFVAVRGENTPERMFVLIGNQTHNQQAMSPTSAPLSHLGGAVLGSEESKICHSRKG